MKKRVLVTGGAKGIGRAIVEDLISNGFEVLATHNKTKDLVQGAKYFCVDLENREELDSFIEQITNNYVIDVLINNAGIYLGEPFEKMSEEELFTQVDLMFAAPARLIHGLLPALMKAKSPLIINISSQAVNERISGEAMYTAVKAALSNLSYILRAELNPRGLRITTVEPFGVNTYGNPEPSNMILPRELAELIRYVIELSPHLQLDTIGISHIKQPRPDYPNWIER